MLRWVQKTSFNSQLPVLIDHDNATYQVSVLIDSGSAVNLIHCRLVKELQLPFIPCLVPQRITAVENNPIGNGFLTHQTPSITLQLGRHTEKVVLFVMSSPVNKIILGFPWLWDRDPQIPFSTKELLSWSPHCFNQCLKLPLKLPCYTTTIDSPKQSQEFRIYPGNISIWGRCSVNHKQVNYHLTGLGIVRLICSWIPPCLRYVI